MRLTAATVAMLVFWGLNDMGVPAAHTGVPLLFPDYSSLLGIWACHIPNSGSRLALADDWDNHSKMPMLVATSCCYGALLTPVTSSHQCCHLLGECYHAPVPSAP